MMRPIILPSSPLHYHVNNLVVFSAHMANIHQEQPSIRNMQVVSSNRVYSTHSCEANKWRFFQCFFCLSDKRFQNIIIKFFLK